MKNEPKYLEVSKTWQISEYKESLVAMWHILVLRYNDWAKALSKLDSQKICKRKFVSALATYYSCVRYNFVQDFLRQDHYKKLAKDKVSVEDYDLILFQQEQTDNKKLWFMYTVLQEWNSRDGFARLSETKKEYAKEEDLLDDNI